MLKNALITVTGRLKWGWVSTILSSSTWLNGASFYHVVLAIEASALGRDMVRDAER